MVDNKQIWNILENYFKENGLVQHQLNSFDEYINHGIQNVISNEADIVVKPNNNQEYKISFGQVYVPSPTIIDDDRNGRIILPSESRERDLTYDSPIYVDIKETIIEDEKLPEINYYPRVLIGRTPVMLRSSICNLSNLSEDERVNEARECYRDPGGYFIIRGKERVIVGQIRGIYNKVLVLEQKLADKFKYIAEVRSMSDETGHSILVQGKIGIDDRTIVFSIPYIKEVMPMGVIFKALGFITDNDIKNLIGLKGEKIKKYLNYIIRDSYFVKTQEEALYYIGKFSVHTIKEDSYIAYAKQVVETEIFPHLGIMSTIKEKALFLGHIANKLLSTYLGFRCEDDRDNYANKRIELTGTLCTDLFRTLFKRYLKTLETMLDKKKQRPDALSIISRNNSITQGLKNSFSTGNWGIQKNSYIRVGVSQVMSRLTYGATLSHLRRIVIPIGKEGKNTKIRQIDPSQIMYICPSETPEGQSVGIVLNLSLLTQVSTSISTSYVRKILEDYDSIISITNITNEQMYNTKVFLNGVLIGLSEDSDETINELRNIRDINILDRSISISYDDIDDEIYIYSDSGRMIRPLFKTINGKLLIQSNDGCNWDSLVEKNIIQYIDNTEIESSIIAMSLKDLNEYNNDYLEISPSMMLGVMASIIPFPDHSQSPRNCYQSSMGKQAIGMFATSYQVRTDTIVHVLDYPQRPLVSTKSAQIMGFNDMPSGINAIVAVMCHTGFNQEDSIIINRSAVQRGLFSSTSYKTLVDEDKQKGTYNKEIIEFPEKEIRKKYINYNFLDKNGIVRKGSNVIKGDAIIGKVLIKSNKSGNEERSDCTTIIKQGEEGIVDRVLITKNSNGYKLIKIIIRKQYIPEIGDKFASRSAQKGTCGMLYNQEDMPFTYSGMVPDIIINSHCLPSRMTINQLMESILGKSCILEGTFGDATPFTKNSVDITEQLCERLSKNGFQKHGWEKMYCGFTGEMIDSKIFIGPTYYQRLKHLVQDKVHSRQSGHVTTLHRQPLSGRSREGGLRFGEMEKDCMIAHGASRILKERLFDQSDPYQVVICNQCGNFATKSDLCQSCETDCVSKVNLPYSAKLLLQELNAMGIKTAIKSKKL